MAHTSQDRNNSFGKCYYDSDYLNHNTSMFENIGIQDPILEIVQINDDDKLRLPFQPRAGVTTATRKTTTRLIAEHSPSSNSRNLLVSKLNLDSERSLWCSFLKKSMQSKGVFKER
jgi:hypothetical protein